jgi:hypothetical protein
LVPKTETAGAKIFPSLTRMHVYVRRGVIFLFFTVFCFPYSKFFSSRRVIPVLFSRTAAKVNLYLQ